LLARVAGNSRERAARLMEARYKAVIFIGQEGTAANDFRSFVNSSRRVWVYLDD
jgi:hypothetical protein